MERHVTSLPIPNNLKTKLVKGGVQSVNELKSITPVDLCKGVKRLYNCTLLATYVERWHFFMIKTVA